MTHAFNIINQPKLSAADLQVLQNHIHSTQFQICNIYCWSWNNRCDVVVGYPNGQYGVFNFEKEGGLPKPDTAQLVYHNCPPVMAGRPTGSVELTQANIDRKRLSVIRAECIVRLAELRYLGETEKAPTPFVWAVKMMKQVSGNDVRLFVSLCEGSNSFNAEFHPSPEQFGLKMERVWHVGNGQEWRDANFYKTGMAEFQNHFSKFDYYEEVLPIMSSDPIQAKQISGAIALWEPTCHEIVFPDTIDQEDDCPFIPGLAYRAFALPTIQLLTHTGAPTDYYCLFDDEGGMHRFTKTELAL